ncbi:MAG: 2-C-methyl-D-erythritol 4-phosphate cytidylyltransferase [Clostridiales bacterium]|nr:2-C-methyl-D-erythritol 4-phosphate cytidylyltransferase [Clostridiales bacterium]
MSNIAVILAAGSGTRMKADKSKLLLDLCGKTVIERTVSVFSRVKEIDEIIVVIRESNLEAFEEHLSSYELSYCFGGDTRQQSMMNALETIDNDCELLIIHDGARPLVTVEEIESTIEKAKETGAAAVGVQPKDTVKIVDDKLQIVGTPDRANLISIRTPQIFEYSLYVKSAQLAKEQGKDFTDDCRLIENAGGKVYAVLGEYSNIKITTPEDIPTAESIIKSRGDE